MQELSLSGALASTDRVALKHGCVYSLQSRGLVIRFSDAVCLVVLLSLKLSDATCVSPPAPPACVDACMLEAFTSSCVQHS